GPLLLGASLLSAEAGIATVAYLLAYLFFIDNEPWLRRVRALLPYLLVVVVWRMVWTGLGYGVANVGLYIDPIQAPFRFGRALIDRLPMLFLSQWGWPPADVSLVLGPDKRHLFWILACVFLLSVFFIGLPLLRRDRIARFWAFGALLSIIPICTTFPSERLLLFVGIGAMGFISQFLVVVFRKNDGNAKWGYPAVGLGVFFIFVHLIIATPTLLVHSAWPVGPKWVMGQFYIQTPFDQRIETQDLILVNPPEAVFALNSLLLWESEHQPLPRHLRVLASSRLRPVTVSRLDDRTLIIRPEKGFIAGDMDRLFRAEDHLLSLGEQVKLTGVFITINELNADHRPATAVFRFSVPLEDSSLRWLQWKDGKFIPFVPPRIGERVILHPGRLSLFPW
ncbi:MAG TPA: hypothetical protein VHR47_01870, partial [Bacillota bacterium]|nr:hypothetical protein [Bacillota bacterium]